MKMTLNVFAAALALNDKEIQKNSERILKIKLFIDKCNWKEMYYSSRKNNWSKYKKNNLKIPFIVLYVKK